MERVTEILELMQTRKLMCKNIAKVDPNCEKAIYCFSMTRSIMNLTQQINLLCIRNEIFSRKCGQGASWQTEMNVRAAMGQDLGDWETKILINITNLMDDLNKLKAKTPAWFLAKRQIATRHAEYKKLTEDKKPCMVVGEVVEQFKTVFPPPYPPTLKRSTPYGERDKQRNSKLSKSI